MEVASASESSSGQEVNSVTPGCTKVTSNAGGHVTWSCDLCIMEFPTQDNLERHKDMAHKV